MRRLLMHRLFALLALFAISGCSYIDNYRFERDSGKIRDPRSMTWYLRSHPDGKHAARFADSLSFFISSEDYWKGDCFEPTQLCLYIVSHKLGPASLQQLAAEYANTYFMSGYARAIAQHNSATSLIERIRIWQEFYNFSLEMQEYKYDTALISAVLSESTKVYLCMEDSLKMNPVRYYEEIQETRNSLDCPSIYDSEYEEWAYEANRYIDLFKGSPNAYELKIQILRDSIAELKCDVDWLEEEYDRLEEEYEEYSCMDEYERHNWL